MPEYCDPFMQNCPEGEKCVPYSSTGSEQFDAHKCVPVLGEQPAGEPCTYAGTAESTDDCDATGVCWNVHDVDGELVGTCYTFCMGTVDTPECPEGTVCPISGSGSLDLCVDTCDPIAQDCDDEGTACYYWATGSFVCIPPLTDLPPGATCGFINDCTAALCVTAEVLPTCDGSSCCASWCDVDLGDDQCAAVPGTACVVFFEQGMAPSGYDHVGVCIVPS